MMKNLFKVMPLINVIFIVAILTLNYFYQSNDFNYVIKCGGSALFVILGIINFGYAFYTKQKDKRFYIGMLIAIIFSMLGDIFIYFSIVAGAGMFAISHLCFIVTYCSIQKLKKLDLIVGILLFIPVCLFLLLSPILTFEEAILQPVGVGYALIISIMFGKAICNFLYEKNILNAVIVLASMLFFFSDFMLIFHFLSNICPWAENACMAMYYPSICLFDFSIYLNSCKNHKNVVEK